MMTEYLKAAMSRAKFEILEDDGSFYGNIPELPGVWANAKTLEECRDELTEVVEEWLLLGIRFGDPIPVMGGIEWRE